MTALSPGALPPNATPLDRAFQRLGIRETSRNRGPEIDEWVRRRRLDPAGAHAWCACFVCAMVEDAGYEIVASARVRDLWLLNRHLAVDDPQPGDVCIHLNANGTGHTAFWLQRVPGEGRIETLDGNSDNQGRREGREVCIVSRPVDYWQHFFRPRPPELVG